MGQPLKLNVPAYLGHCNVQNTALCEDGRSKVRRLMEGLTRPHQAIGDLMPTRWSQCLRRQRCTRVRISRRVVPAAAISPKPDHPEMAAQAPRRAV